MYQRTLRSYLLLFLLSLSHLCLAGRSLEVQERHTIYGTHIKKDHRLDSNSLSLISSERIQQMGAHHLDELIDYTSNINMAGGTSRARYFQIRGIGERSSYEGMPNHSVGIILDDIDYSGIGGVSHLNGISQVEVYKGPQASRFGPNALAGMIYMSSTTPTHQYWRSELSTSYSSYNTFENSLHLSSPVSDNSAISLNIARIQSDGYFKNQYLQRKNTNKKSEKSLRAQWQTKLDQTDILFTLHYFDFDNGYDAFSHDNSFNTRSDRPGHDTQETFAQALKIQRGITPHWQSTSILTHLKNDNYYSYDEDWGNDPLWQSTPDWEQAYDYSIEFEREREDFSLDQRFTHTKNTTIGVYYKNSQEDFRETAYNQGDIRRNVHGQYKTQNLALYSQHKSPLSSNWSLQAGIRLEQRNAKYNDSNDNQFDPSEFMYGGEISLLHYNRSNGLNYLKLSRGHKAGGVNTQSAVPTERKEFEQENLYSLELGSKNQFINNKLIINGAIFFMLRENMQVETSFQNDPQDPSSFTFYTDNATRGNVWGAEIDLTTQWTPQFRSILELGLLETRFGSYQYGERQLRGREMPHAPKYQTSLILEYTRESGLYIQSIFRAQDQYYFSNSHDQRAKASQVVDLTAGIKRKSFNFSLWVKNIFNEKTHKRGFFFSNEPPRWTEQLYVHRGAPRVIGVSLRYRFGFH